MVGAGEDGSRTSTAEPAAARVARAAARRRAARPAGRRSRGRGRCRRARALAAGERLEQARRARSGGMPGPSSSTRMTSCAVVAHEPDARRCRPAGRAARRCRAGCRPAAAGRPPSRRRCPRRRGRRARSRTPGWRFRAPCTRGVEQVAELDRLARQALGRLAAGERLQALEQVDHAVLLGGHVGHERLALLARQLGVAGERVEVGRAARSAACAARGRRRRRSAASPRARAPWRRSEAPRRASISLSAPASWRTSSGRRVVGQRRREVLGAA